MAVYKVPQDVEVEDKLTKAVFVPAISISTLDNDVCENRRSVLDK